ncbi:MAG: hypothetical protein KDA44_04525 [Planctomycetales bacterium]|nr:hypothetical protein [Planctomycetales bacterium]
MINIHGDVALICGAPRVQGSEGPPAGLGAIWAENAHLLRLVVSAGDEVPGGPAGLRYAAIADPYFSDAGTVAYRAVVFGLAIPSTDYYGAWAGKPGDLQSILQLGDTPSATGATVTGINKLVLGTAGQAVVSASDSRPRATLWAAGAGSLQLILDGAQQPVGYPTGSYLQTLSAPDEIGVNNRGQVVYAARSATRGGRQGIWLADKTETRLLASQYAPLPGMPAMNRVDGVGSPSLNRYGDVAFVATYADLTVPGQLPPEITGIWVDRQGTLEHITSSIDPPKQFASVTNWSLDSPRINAQGAVLFAATLSGGPEVTASNDLTVWVDDPVEGRRLVYREGSHPEGASADAVFGDGELAAPFVLPNLVTAINARGQVALWTSLEMRGTDTRVGTGIWAEDADHRLRPIVMTGQPLELASGDVRVVESLLFAGNANTEDGHRVGLNDRGQVAFQATFTDGTWGVFVSNAVAVPEPTALILMATFAIFVGLRATVLRTLRRVP